MYIYMNLTCVSTFFKVKNKYTYDKYIKWFQNTLDINCPYVFFANKEGIELIKPFRKDYPTYYIECEIEDFVTYSYKDRMITHPIHCPSIELNLIWNEKIFMLQKAKNLNPFQTDWFKWIDAGINIYRNKTPQQNISPLNIANKLDKLPNNKMIYSSSEPYKPTQITKINYCHHISGTTYIIHKNAIDNFATIYKHYLEIIDKNNIWTDQVIWTHIYKKYPKIFYKLCDGYGKITSYLFE